MTLLPYEEQELQGLVYQAWELKPTPYFHDALQAICDWYERRPIGRLEYRRQRKAELGFDRLERLLDRTDPSKRLTA